MRNGGRHCCQPPLRRAKDLPVFDLPWSRSGKPVCDPASRSWLTSSGVASHRTAPSCEEPDRSTRLRGPKVRWSFALSGPAFWDRNPSKPKPSDVPRPFLGRPLSRPASLTRPSVPTRRTANPGAASRLRKTTLPAPLPGWPGKNPKALPNPAGGDRTFGHLPRPRAVAGSWGGRDRRPDHPCTMHPSPESGKRKFRLPGCG